MRRTLIRSRDLLSCRSPHRSESPSPAAADEAFKRWRMRKVSQEENAMSVNDEVAQRVAEENLPRRRHGSTSKMGRARFQTPTQLLGRAYYAQ